MVKALIIGAALALSACTQTLAPIADPVKVWCDNNEPIYASPAAVAVMIRRELDTMNAHNLKGESWCGWERPNR